MLNMTEGVRSTEDKLKAARSGSRLQNRACDQCRRSKRRCDLAEAGPDGLPLQHAGPCKLCVRKNLQCTTHWSELQQTVSSSRQELRHISQKSASYSALQDQLALRQYRPAGLSSTSKELADTIDGIYITAQHILIYVSAWEWTWHHFLGPSCAPLGVGLDVIANPRFGLLSPSITQVWERFSIAGGTQHISPKFFYSNLACDEAYRREGRLKRLPPKADEISNQALQYAILAYASQFGSQGLQQSEEDFDPDRRAKDIQIAEATWTRARDFLMRHATVKTFRMAYAFHVFANTCPPMRSARAESDPTQDAVFILQTGLRMLDDLSADLRRQQQENLYALGYLGIDGSKMDDELLLGANPDYRQQVDRSKALIGVAENLLWYSMVCDSAAATSFGMPPVTRGSHIDSVDLDNLLKPFSSAANPSQHQQTQSQPQPLHHLHEQHNQHQRHPSLHELHQQTLYDSATGSVFPSFNAASDMGALLGTRQDGFATMMGVAAQHLPHDSDHGLLRLAPGSFQPDMRSFGLPTSSSWEAPPQDSGQESIWTDSEAGVENQFAATKPSWTSASDDSRDNPWVRIALRVQKVSQRVPAVLDRLSMAPEDPTFVKELLALCQTAAASQVMIWQRIGNFRFRLNDPSCAAEKLVESFRRALSVITFVQRSFQPLLDLDPNLYFRLPPSAQVMVVHFINNASAGTLHFLESCSLLEGVPWLQNTDNKPYPRAALILRESLDQCRIFRNELRRQSALRICLASRIVQEQVERTMGSPLRSAGRSSFGSAGDHRPGSGSADSTHFEGLSDRNGSVGSVPESDGGRSGTGSAFASSASSPSPSTPSSNNAGRVMRLPQDEMLVPALQVHTSRHPIPGILADSLHLSFCALVPDALQEINQNSSASAMTLDALDSALLGLQEIFDTVLSFGPFYSREPSAETLVSTRNWLAPDRSPMTFRM